MTSYVLLEGFLDVKDPRGSEVRKFWKVWRRQWISFSVIYPSGRREPFLLLQMSHCSSEFPEKQITIQRDSLRLFRCRSKSRPYRTWAIMCGNKLVLYFAAESELQAQNWMQEVRGGLWPSCFSFQMLTACSYEVSLIDDDNTFLSGLLGVYGRLVLTAEDVISLMHPHWGSTQLQISLSNVQDVLFVREAEIPPAGVFSIILKSKEDSRVKALQFFCSRARDAMQWILNKLYIKDCKSHEKTTRLSSEHAVFTSNIISPENTNELHFKNSGFPKENPSVSTDRIHDTNININDSNVLYENLQVLFTEKCINYDKQNISEYNVVGERTSLKNETERVSFKHDRTNDLSIDTKTVTGGNPSLDDKTLNFKLNESNFNANIIPVVDSTKMKFQNHNNNDGSVVSKDLGPIYANESIWEEYFDLEEKLSLLEISKDTSDSIVHPTVNNHSTLEDSPQQTTEHQFLTSGWSENIESSGIDILPEIETSKLINTELSAIPSSTEEEKGKINYSEVSSTESAISNDFPNDKRTIKEKSIFSNIDVFPKFHSQITSNTDVYGIVNKQMNSHYPHEKPLNEQFSTGSFTSNKDSQACMLEGNNLPQKIGQRPLRVTSEGQSNDCDPRAGQGISAASNVSLKNLKSEHFPNTLCDFLNTGITKSSISKEKISSEYSSSEDIEIFTWLNNLELAENVYEDIADRKGTLYEEIDASESEEEVSVPLPPTLPKRPQNLEIPDNLRLQKLSKSIKQSLEVIDSRKLPTKGYPQTTFIKSKKIKEVGRIMQISPNQESAREPFTIETKLPTAGRNGLILTPTVIDSPGNIKANTGLKQKRVT